MSREMGEPSQPAPVRAADGEHPEYPPRSEHGPVLTLLILFGSLYFVQGIVEPTAGMVSQPIQTQLEGWGWLPGQITAWQALVGIPWSLKPLFGLVSDFFPLGGRRRRPYLILSTAAAGAAFLWLAGQWGSPSGVGLAGWLLLAACGWVAVTDVVVDALAVETGQPLGLTGQMQSVQWGAMSAATIIGSALGGIVAGRRLLGPAFIGCGLLALASLVVVLVLVREPRHQTLPSDNLRLALRQLGTGRRAVILMAVSLYLFLWNFNPFSSSVLQLYATQELHLSEEFYGLLGSIQAAAQIVACVGYGLVCRRIPFGWLIHGSIAAGILSTLCYWPMHDATTAVLASLVFGLTYQLATLIQLDLAARVCPTEAAGTIFALLMAISNTGITAATWVSGSWYDGLTDSLGSRHAAFDALVAIGAAFTAGCWLVVPVMRWAGVEWK